MTSYRFDMFILVLNLDDLGLVRETLIFKTWKLTGMIEKKYAPPEGELSSIFIFTKL